MHIVDGVPEKAALARVLSALVALAAGIVGIGMLAAPGSTGRYFSWALGPPALAQLVGAFYVASAAVFGWAARGSWRGLRGLCVAVFGLTLPTLVATAVHRGVFDFDRWQARAWVVLFVASPLLFGLTVARGTRPSAVAGPRLAGWARATAAGLAAVYGALAIVCWAAPGAVSNHGPFAAGPMGIRFVAGWAAFLAILATYAARRGEWGEARMPVVALLAWPGAGLLAALARLDDLRAGAPRWLYLGGLAVLALAVVPVLVAGRAHAGRSSVAASRPALSLVDAA